MHDGHVLTRALKLGAEERRKKCWQKKTYQEADGGRMNECWFEQGSCDVQIKMEYWHKSDCH